MSEKNYNLYKIKVINTESKASYVHHRVPLEHVEMLRMNTRLIVEILGRSKGRSNEDKPQENTA